MFRSVSFPDVLPRLGPKFHLLEGDFLQLPIPKPPPSAKSASWTADPSTNTPVPSTLREDTSVEGYDYVVTLFFIDTSYNILSTLSQIYALLKPGGTWVNLGPLLWSSGGQAKLELTLEEVIASAKEIGFIFEKGANLTKPYARNDEIQEQEIDPELPRTVECEYTADPEAMMRWTYKAEFWVARRPS